MDMKRDGGHTWFDCMLHPCSVWVERYLEGERTRKWMGAQVTAERKERTLLMYFAEMTELSASVWSLLNSSGATRTPSVNSESTNIAAGTTSAVVPCRPLARVMESNGAGFYCRVGAPSCVKQQESVGMLRVRVVTLGSSLSLRSPRVRLVLFVW